MGACTEVFPWKPKDPQVKTGNYWSTWTRLVPGLCNRLGTKTDEREAGAIIVKEHFFLLSTFGPHPNPDTIVRSSHPFVTKLFVSRGVGPASASTYICIGLRQVVLLFTARNRVKSTLTYTCSKHEHYYYWMDYYSFLIFNFFSIYMCVF